MHGATIKTYSKFALVGLYCIRILWLKSWL